MITISSQSYRSRRILLSSCLYVITTLEVGLWYNRACFSWAESLCNIYAAMQSCTLIYDALRFYTVSLGAKFSLTHVNVSCSYTVAAINQTIHKQASDAVIQISLPDADIAYLFPLTFGEWFLYFSIYSLLWFAGLGRRSFNPECSSHRCNAHLNQFPIRLLLELIHYTHPHTNCL